MKGTKAIVILFAALVCALAFSACSDDQKKLQKPTGVHVTAEDVLVWDNVKSADGYSVYIDGEEYDTATNSLDLFELLVEPKTYGITLKAYCKDRGIDDSDWSEPIQYSVQDCIWDATPLNKGSQYILSLKNEYMFSGKIVVPAFYNNKPVIRFDGLSDAKGVTSLLLPDTIKDSFSISSCENLTRVKLSAFLKKLGSFINCTSLKQIYIPASVVEIDPYNFSGCDGLNSIEVDPENEVYKSDGNCIIRKADNAIIKGCKSSVIPDYVTSIEGEAFRDYAGLEELTIPQCTENLTKGFVKYCPDLKSLKVAENNKVYKSDGNCIIRIADNVVIAGCGSSTIPDYVTTIGAYAFSESSAKYIELPEGVVEIEERAFADAELEEVSLPKSLQTIGVGAFSSTKLKEVSFPESLQTIGVGAFSSTELKEVSFPESLQTIGDKAFYKVKLEEVLFTESLQTIGKEAFAGHNMRYLQLPSTLQSIGKHAFVFGGDYVKGTTVILPSSIKSIGVGAFSYCGTIYTSATNIFHDGWTMKDLGAAWFGVSHYVVFNCDLAYDGIKPYVRSVLYKHIKNDPYTIFSILFNDYPPSSPCRGGYEFMGWATESDSRQVVYPPKLIVVSDEYRYNTPFGDGNLFDSDGKPDYKPGSLTYPDNTVMYAVWEKSIGA